MDSDTKSILRDYYACWLGLNGLYERWAKRHGLSLYSLLVLCALQNSEGLCTQKRICEEWVMPKQTVNTILKRFERQGCLRFQVTPEDHRNKAVLLTDAGRRYAREITGALAALESSALERMDAGESGELCRLNRVFFTLLRSAMEGGGDR